MEEAQGSSHPDIESLKMQIVGMWEEMESSYTIKICKSFCQHVEADIVANSGHIEWEGRGSMSSSSPSQCLLNSIRLVR